MNRARYELMKNGQDRFLIHLGHMRMPIGLALAVYASSPEKPNYHPVVLTDNIINPKILNTNLGLEDVN